MRELQEAIQLSTVLITALIIFIGYKWTVRNPTRFKWSVPPLTFLTHIIIYYSYIFASSFLPLPVGFFGFWSTVIKFHIVAILLILIYTLYKLNGKIDNGTKYL
jgi:hypothetical protein